MGELREYGFHGSGLFDGALLDLMAVSRRKAGESLLEGLDVEEGDWKKDRYNSWYSRVGRELHPGAQRLPVGTSGRLFDTAEEGWTECDLGDCLAWRS